MKFSDINLDPSLLEGLDYMGFVETTPIQAEAIPKILEGKDLLACAQTGTGKTAAFILPVLHKLASERPPHVRALVLAPTRELAMQIEEQIQAFAYFLDLSCKSIYGGGDGAEFEAQKRALETGADIIVATPGRLIAHIQNKYAGLDKVEYFILDEADRMLDMGFLPDIQKIADQLPQNKQSLLFSATMPPKIRSLSKQMLRNPDEISIAISKPAEGLIQAAYVVHEHQKAPLIRQLIKDKPNYESIIIFSSTKKKISEIVKELRRESYTVEAISSDLNQEQRETALRNFNNRSTRVLVATDVLSRGIDIKGINLVINYDVPRDAEDYVHRIGRTARADESGVALTMINPDDVKNMMDIERLIEKEVMKLPLPPGFEKGPEYKVVKYNRNRSSQGRGHSGRGQKSRKGNHRHKRRKD